MRCSVVFGVTLRLLVINISSSSPATNTAAYYQRCVITCETCDCESMARTGNVWRSLPVYAHKYDHVTPLLMDLRWLRVPERVKFRLCVLIVALLERRRDIWQSWQCMLPVLLVVAYVQCHLLILSCLPLAVQPSVTVRSLLPVHECGTAYHLIFEHLHHHSTRLRNI